MSRILKCVSDLPNFVTILESARESGQSVSKTKVTANVTPRGRSEVSSASTRSKNNIIDSSRFGTAESAPPAALFLTLPYTSFRFPLASLSARSKPKGSVKEKRGRRR